MPRPTQSEQRYVAGLDGIRAIAVLCVIAYHLNVPQAQGGMLGVGVFFTLSGYLITDLLIGHYRRHGHLGLSRFWLRRARRLLPALFLMLAVVGVWVAVFDASQLDAVRRQTVSAALYFANWSTIAAHGSYFSRFAAPLPLDHLWSLSIEEQFYLVWPWLLWLGLRWTPNRWVLAGVMVLAAAASAWMMGALFHPGYDPTRVYEGTDTRAFGLLIGAALAVLWPTTTAPGAIRTPATPAAAVLARRRAAVAASAPGRCSPTAAASRSPERPPSAVASARPGRPPSAVLDLLGLAGLAAIVLLVVKTTAYSRFLYPTGFLLLSVATAALIAAVVHPASRLGAVLGSRPLRFIGVRSYGIYLWQWPVIVLWKAPAGTFQPGTAALQVAVTLAIASTSWRFVEDPIRRGALGRLWDGRRRAGAATRLRSRFAAVLTGAATAVALAAAGLGGALPVASAGVRAPQRLASLPARLPASAFVRDRASGRRSRGPHAIPTTTSCRSVVYIGDSTSESEVLPDYLSNPELRLPSQLARVGVRTTILEISGARSTVETFEGHPNAASVAQQHISEGYHGCWILAVGTNDVANVQAGATPGMSARIAHMLSIIGDQPIMWVDVISRLAPGQPYSEDGMQRFNQDLVSACAAHPNLRVFDWASQAKAQWFIPDEIHYGSAGAAARAHLTARALVQAFPAGGGASPGCVVR